MNKKMGPRLLNVLVYNKKINITSCSNNFRENNFKMISALPFGLIRWLFYIRFKTFQQQAERSG